MKKISNRKEETRKFGGKLRTQWEDEWQELKGGFAARHLEPYGYVGLYRAKLGQEVMFVGCTSVTAGGGLYKRLTNFRSCLQSSNDHYGALKIRENIDTLVLEVIYLGRTWRHGTYAVALRNAMIKHHQPAWNVRKGGKK